MKIFFNIAYLSKFLLEPKELDRLSKLIKDFEELTPKNNYFYLKKDDSDSIINFLLDN
jgi:hypothetical protein